MSDDETLWWGEPINARRFHVFEGERPLARSLCGNWMMGYGAGDLLEVDPEEDTWKDGRDCKKCARRADVLGGDSA